MSIPSFNVVANSPGVKNGILVATVDLKDGEKTRLTVGGHWVNIEVEKIPAPPKYRVGQLVMLLKHGYEGDKVDDRVVKITEIKPNHYNSNGGTYAYGFDDASNALMPPMPEVWLRALTPEEIR